MPFPFLLGCVDEMYIQQPKTDNISYYNRKGIFLIVVQAKVDSKMRLTDVFDGYPGRCHDTSVA